MGKRNKTADNRWQRWVADVDDEFRYDIVLNESDRGAVLVAAAFVEEALEHLLRQLLTAKSCNTSNEKFSAQLDKFVKPIIESPLGSFAARITGCFVLGVIDVNYFEALEALRSLRNGYAHRKTDGSRPQLTLKPVEIIIQAITGPGVWDIRFLGLLPSDLDFDATVAKVGLPRIAFATAIWIMLCSIRMETAWWKTNGKPSTPIRAIPKFDGPTFQAESE